jgi:hypothetical protein
VGACVRLRACVRACERACVPGARFFAPPLLSAPTWRGAGNVTRWQLLQVFLALESGSHVTQPWVELYKVQEMVLEPLSPAAPMNLSGEREFPAVAQPVHLRVLQAAVTMAQ